jgi:hypothetical protein
MEQENLIGRIGYAVSKKEQSAESFGLSSAVGRGRFRFPRALRCILSN